MVFTSATSAKTSTRSKLLRFLPVLHISQRIRSIMCTFIFVQILLYKYCYKQCNVLYSQVKNCFKNIFEFKSKDKYERKMLNRLKRNFKRKIYVNSFCLRWQVLLFFGAGRWTDGKRMKQHKSCFKMWIYRILLIRWIKTWKQTLFYCHTKKKKEDE